MIDPNKTMKLLSKNEMHKFRTKTLDEFSKSELIEKINYERKIFRRILKRRLRPILASGVLFLLGTGLLVYNDQKLITPDELFNQYYDGIDFSTEAGVVGIKAFVDGDWMSATVNIEDEVKIDGKFIRALALLEQREYKEASKVLNAIDSERADWYQALCLIQFDPDSAEILFRKIHNGKGLYSSQAKEILNCHFYSYNPKPQK